MDNRIYNLKGLNSRLSTLERGKEYTLLATYSNHDTAELPKANITIEWLKRTAEINQDGTLERFRIYDNKRCLASFDVAILNNVQLYDNDYNQDLRTLARPDRHAEKRLAKTLVLLPPTTKQKLKLKAGMNALSMNQVINQLVEAYVSNL